MIITTNLGKLAICPYRPLIEAVENWQYVTDIFEAVDSTEERIALRQLPRQTLKYSYAMGVAQIPAFFNLFYGAMRSQWAVPIWFEGQTLGNVNKGTLALTQANSRIKTARREAVEEYSRVQSNVLSSCITEYRNMAKVVDEHRADAGRKP